MPIIQTVQMSPEMNVIPADFEKKWSEKWLSDWPLIDYNIIKISWYFETIIGASYSCRVFHIILIIDDLKNISHVDLMSLFG